MNTVVPARAWAPGVPPLPAARMPRPRFAAAPAPRVLSPAQLINQQEALAAALAAAMNDASQQVPAAQRQAFAARAAAMVRDVVADSMYPVHSEMIRSPGHAVRWESYQAAAARARGWVERHKQVALSLLPMADPAPHLQALPSGQILMLRAAPSIENLVLSGGGARGVGNAPALRALENLGLLSALQRVAGNSVGGMTAIVLAAGISAKEFQRWLNGTQVLSLLQTPADFKRSYPEVKLGTLGFDGGTALQTLDRMVALSAAQYLDGHWREIVRMPQWAGFTPAQQQRLELLRTPDFSAPRTGRMLTFGDLHLLRQLDPQRFKELVVAGWNQTQQRVVYFSRQTYPEMPLALAGRISMGIPVLFADVKFEAQRWTDGGVGSNLPTEAIFSGLSGEALRETYARTLVMAFADGGRTHAVLHGPPDRVAPAVSPLVTWLSGNPQFPQAMAADQRKLHAAGLHAMPVAHVDLGVASFLYNNARVQRAKTEAMDQALAFIAQNRHNFRHDLVDDVEAAAALLSPAEQQAFLARPDGNAAPLDASLRAAILAQQAAQQAAQAPGAGASELAAARAWASRSPLRTAA